MAKRIIIISSLSVYAAIVITAIVFAGAAQGQIAVTPANIEQAKDEVISLIEAGKSDDANAIVDKIIALPKS
jgi:hypothetical protein